MGQVFNLPTAPSREISRPDVRRPALAQYRANEMLFLVFRERQALDGFGRVPCLHAPNQDKVRASTRPTNALNGPANFKKFWLRLRLGESWYYQQTLSLASLGVAQRSLGYFFAGAFFKTSMPFFVSETTFPSGTAANGFPVGCVLSFAKK